MKSKKYFLFLFLTLSCLWAYAQPENDPTDNAIPVDGGVAVLFAAGAVWGVKKLKEKK